MKHTPQLPDEEVNVSREHPLREMARLAVAVALLATVAYVLSGFLVDLVVNRLDSTTGRGLRDQVAAAVDVQFGGLADEAAASPPAALFAWLIEQTGRDQANYDLLVVDNELVNAVALPGGVVVVFSGLLEEVRSENELAMVLAHELGHLDNKDHLRMAGRGILWAGMNALVLGNSGAMDALLVRLPSTALETRFSRRRELAADRTGLEIVCQAYGHSGGAADFFARHVEEDGDIAFFATHPTSRERVDALAQLARELNCEDGEKKALSPAP